MSVEAKVPVTKVFMNGRSQAVRIPAEFRFEEAELYINKIGDSLILTPRSALIKTFHEGNESVQDDFMQDGRPEEIPVVREDL